MPKTFAMKIELNLALNYCNYYNFICIIYIQETVIYLYSTSKYREVIGR